MHRPLQVGNAGTQLPLNRPFGKEFRYVINHDKPFYPNNVMTDIPPQAEIFMLIGFHTEAKSKIYVQYKVNVLNPRIDIYLVVGPLPFYVEVIRRLHIMDQVGR